MEKLVSSQVVGSANPFMRFFRDLGASIKGIGTGFLMIIASFVVVWMFANQVKHSKTIEALPLLTPAEVMDTEGMVKIHAVPNISGEIIAPNTDKSVLYYYMSTEDYAIRETTKTRTRVENGQEIKDTYLVYEPAWRGVDSSSKWAEFDLGGITIYPDRAKLQINTTNLYDKTEDQPYDKTLPEVKLVDVPQKIRTVVKGIMPTDDIIVVGMLSEKKIADGDESGTFFVSNKGEAQFLSDQVKSEKTWFWVMAFAAWLLMTLGFTMLVGPIMKILNIIPGPGGLLNSVIFFVFGVISAIIVFLAYVGIKFWWAILLGSFALVAFFIFSKVKKDEKKPA